MAKTTLLIAIACLVLLVVDAFIPESDKALALNAVAFSGVVLFLGNLLWVR